MLSLFCSPAQRYSRSVFALPSIERKHIQATFSIKNGKGLAVFLINNKKSSPTRKQSQEGVILRQTGTLNIPAKAPFFSLAESPAVLNSFLF
jgi:hypothetical protein